MNPVIMRYVSSGEMVPRGTCRITERYVQKRPYDLVLPYKTGYRRCIAIEGPNATRVDIEEPMSVSPSFPWFSRNPTNTFAHSSLFDPDYGPLHGTVEDSANKALKRFSDALSKQSQLGSAFAEWRQSSDMICKRATQLLAFSSSLRRLDFRGAARALNLVYEKRTKNHYLRTSDGRVFKTKLDDTRKFTYRERARQLGNNWLEYWMGWAPLVGDIYNACQFFSEPLKAYRVSVSASASARDARTYDYDFYTSDSYDCRCTTRCRITAYVGIENPNLYALNRLGLLNPATIVWQVTPFSWLVGWFINVEQYLDSISMPAGLDLVRTSTSYKQESTCVFKRYVKPNNRWGAPPGVDWTCYSDAKSFWRECGIPSVQLRISRPDRLSVTRAATLISLLIQRGLKAK